MSNRLGPQLPAAMTAAERNLRPMTALPFNPATLEYQLNRDAVIRWAAIIGMIFAYFGVHMTAGVVANLFMAILIGLMTLWIAFNITTGTIARSLIKITAAIDSNPQLAETLVALGLRSSPLTSGTRLLLYHRLAVLRYRQKRYQETAELAAALIHIDDGSLRSVRANLLLILAECRIRSRDLTGAYYALGELVYLKLSLSESLQRLLLQTHYEVLAGHSLSAVTGWRDKIEMADMMPAQQASALHELVGLAAQQQDLAELGAWLLERSRLLAAQSDSTYERPAEGSSVV
jgi:hypothetical protein